MGEEMGALLEEFGCCGGDRVRMGGLGLLGLGPVKVLSLQLLDECCIIGSECACCQSHGWGVGEWLDIREVLDRHSWLRGVVSRWPASQGYLGGSDG